MSRATVFPLVFLLALSLAACGGRGGDPDDVPGGNGGGGGGGGPIGSGESIYLNVLPPGANGNSAGGIGGPLPEIPTLQYPDNFRDQLDLYGNLAYAQQGLKSDTCDPPNSIDEHQARSDQACNYFKDHGLEPDTVVSTRELTAPNGSTVTIRRNGWGVPFITGEDRAAAQYGMGFAAAQDRLWLFDLLRQVGRGRASEMLGPSPTTYDLDIQFGEGAAYSEQELTDIVDAAIVKIGPLGQLFLSDVEMFVAGMNAYIDFLFTPEGVPEIPPEYATLALGLGLPPKFPPRDFTVNDIVANAVLIQTQFGRGGGSEANNVRLLQSQNAIGNGMITGAGCDLWRDLRHANDPDTSYTTTTVFDTQSPASVNENCPQTLPAGAAIWDADSFRRKPLFGTASGPLPLPLPGLPDGLPGFPGLPFSLPGLSLASSLPMLAQVDEPVTPPLRHGIRQDTQVMAMASLVSNLRRAFVDEQGSVVSLSNWIGANATQTESGHPIIVAGPQTSYFVPQLLWEAAVVSNGGTPFELAARGISTVNLPYIVIGRGRNFAWSATSAGSDLIDTRVSRMCNTDGSPIAGTANAGNNFDGDGDGFPDADGYRYDGECVRFYRRVDEWDAVPTLASVALGGPTATERVTRHVLRTHYGPVIATATVGGAPVAISEQRSTFFGDVDTTAPFALLTTTGTPMTHARFKQLFNSMTSTFNWIYADSRDLAFIQSGLYPQRAECQHPELPVWGDGSCEWVVDQNLPANFFQQFGGDGNNGAKSFPSRARPVVPAGINPLDGYLEWPGYLQLAAHIQDTNPGQGYLANWNNSGAPGWWAADGNGTYGPTHRMELLQRRLQAFAAAGKKHTVASMIEVMADAAFTDLRGQDLLPLLLQIMQAGGLTADQQAVVTLMQAWIDEGSHQWIGATAPGGVKLGGYRRDRDQDGIYDQRAAVVLMDAWYLRLMPALLPQMEDVLGDGGALLVGRLDAPRQQGSAYQEGWYQHMRRVLQMALDTPGHTDYRVLRCAGTGAVADCRNAVLAALDQALADLGGLGNQANWDGTQLANNSGEAGATVEEYDNVHHTAFSFIPVPTIHWINRPTWQQVAQPGE